MMLIDIQKAVNTIKHKFLLRQYACSRFLRYKIQVRYIRPTFRPIQFNKYFTQYSTGVNFKFDIVCFIHPVQVPRWPSNFAPGIKTKLSDFNGVSLKKIKFTRASWFFNGELSKNYVWNVQRFHKIFCYRPKSKAQGKHLTI